MRENPLFFNAIADLLDEAVWILERQPDGDYRVTDVNQRGLDNTGWAAADVLGQTVRRLYGSGKAEQLHEIYDYCAAWGESQVFHDYHDNGDQRHWYFTKVAAMPPIEGRVRVAHVSLDITYRIMSDALLRAINHAQLAFIKGEAPQSIFDGLLEEVLQLTRSGYGFIGEVRYDESDDHPLLEFFAVSDRAWTPEMRAVVQPTTGGTPSVHMTHLFGVPIATPAPIIVNAPAHAEHGAELPAGHPPIETFLCLPFVHQGVTLGLLGLANRHGGYHQELVEFLQPLITTCVHLILGYQSEARRQSAENQLRLLNEDLEHRVANRTMELESANHKLRELDQMKSKFVATVAHELRHPVGVLKMELYLLTHGHGRDGDAHLRKMTRQVDIFSDLIEKILDLSRLDLARSISRERLDLNETVRSVVEAYASMAAEAGLRFEVVLAPEPLWMLGVANQIAQVVTNLVVNAIRYTPSGGVVVTTAAVPATSQVRLAVRDTGIGIDPNDLPRLFERFYRGAQHGANAHIPGTGLGLAIVKEVVDLHSGTILVDSVLGQGTTFTVVLPALHWSRPAPDADHSMLTPSPV